MRKKLLSLALALVMCLSLTIPAFAAAPFTYDEKGSLLHVTNVLEYAEKEMDWLDGSMLSFTCTAPASFTPGDAFDLTKVEVTIEAIKVPIELTLDNYEDYRDDYVVVYDDESNLFTSSDGKTLTLTEPGCYVVTISDKDIIPSGQTYGARINPPCLVNVQTATDAAPAAAGNFTDVKAGDYFAESVQWAVEKKITTGTSAATFSPHDTCTQGQILTFLWRAKGELKPAGAVSGTQYYAAAAQWAKEQGLTDDFTAGADCTRAMVVTYLWKLAGSPKTGTSDFSDVPADADYAQAVAYAVEQGITTGTSDTTFSPNSVCTRGQIVTFLCRALAK